MAEEMKKDATSGEESKNKWYSYTSSRETMKGWPRLLEGRADVPPAFLPGGVFDGEAFPYTVFVPENVVFLNGRAVKTRQKITALFPDRIVVLEGTRAGVERVEHPLDRIQYLRIEDVLLSAVVSLCSPAGLSRVGFNAVRDNLFEPVTGAVRKYWNRGASSVAAPEAARVKIEAVPGISYKFVNYAVKSLFGGGKINAIAFKDSVNLKTSRKGLFRFVDHFTSPTLLMKTESELIAVEEPAKMRPRKKMEYGGIFTFIPLEKIEKTTLEAGLPLKLVIRLEGGETVQLLYADSVGLEAFLYRGRRSEQR